jgi:high affinity Mn2+ porin
MSLSTFAVLLFARAAQGQARARDGCHGPFLRLLGAQSTLIGQDLRPFPAAYSGLMSLTNRGDRQLSQSYGAYTGACLTTIAAYVDVEMIRGSGIGHASGLGAVTNGDVLRQGSVDLGTGPYVARAFVRWTLPFGGEQRDTIVAATDAMPAIVPRERMEIVAGKLAVTDVFDVNRYANSTRTQFLDWVLFNDGAWDYAADTRGYSNGIAVSWLAGGWALRVGSFQMPTFANGNRFDGDVARARGDNVELTMPAPHDAVVRVLAYVNHARMGRYAEATAAALASGDPPDIVADDVPGRVKWGFGLNGELPLADGGDTGLFGRFGWNDGHTESFVFTEVDRHASAGVQLSGQHWQRSSDVFGVALVADGLSPNHRAYLAAGGTGFLLGDGRLRYGRETVGESYYRLALGRHASFSPDVIAIVNPGYNRDRGPAIVWTGRLNWHW